MTRTQKLAKISQDMSDGYKFVKLRLIIEAAENDSNADTRIIEKIDYLLDTFNALLDSV